MKVYGYGKLFKYGMSFLCGLLIVISTFTAYVLFSQFTSQPFIAVPGLIMLGLVVLTVYGVNELFSTVIIDNRSISYHSKLFKKELL